MVDRLVSVDTANYRLPDTVLQALASDVADPETAFGSAFVEAVDTAIDDADIPGRVETVVADLDLPSTSTFDAEFENDEAFLGDQDGTPSKVGFDRDGEIAEATMRSAFGKGMPRTSEATGSEIAIGDEEGNPSWMQAGVDGLPTSAAKWAIVNAVGAYTGPSQPFAYPGRLIIWTVTDTNGDIIDVRKVDNR